MKFEVELCPKEIIKAIADTNKTLQYVDIENYCYSGNRREKVEKYLKEKLGFVPKNSYEIEEEIENLGFDICTEYTSVRVYVENGILYFY